MVASVPEPSALTVAKEPLPRLANRRTGRWFGRLFAASRHRSTTLGWSWSPMETQSLPVSIRLPLLPGVAGLAGPTVGEEGNGTDRPDRQC